MPKADHSLHLYALHISSLLTFFFSLISFNANGKSPSELFETVSPSIVVVYGKDAYGTTKSLGSGVVLSPGEVATNCHVVAKSTVLTVKHRDREYPAKLRLTDYDRDICILTASGLNAPAVTLGSTAPLKVGHKIFAIGAPKGLVLTLSEGIISGFREDKRGRYLQISAPISPGSSGGGLFDDQGRLVGLPTFYLAESQQLNFAVPVEWIKDILKSNSQATAAPENPANSSQLLLRCNGYEQKLTKFTSPVMPTDQLGPPQQESITVIIDKEKKTIRSDPPFFLFSTDEKSGKLIAWNVPYIEDEVSYKAILPEKFSDDDGGSIEMRFGMLWNTYRIDRLIGDLTYDVDVSVKNMLGRSYSRYRGTFKCKPMADRAF